MSEGKEPAGEGGGLSLATSGGKKVGEGGRGAVVGGVTVDVDIGRGQWKGKEGGRVPEGPSA